MNDVYYRPEEYGLENIAEYDFYDEAYQFDLVNVWREEKTGKLWAATDSGCSCPVPYEDHKFPVDFTEIRSIGDLHGLLKREASDYYHQKPTAHFVAIVEQYLA